eukprot:NODE_733_length_4352_cov_0.444862.p2 type:complete len:385 gc:universal NODE_733_length_4352_cov_0.444862:2181-3335(+)
MVPKKSKSKRLTLKMKYKIQKRVSQHHKKQRKEAKKNPQSKKKQVDTIPKMMPNREAIIENLKNRKPLLQISEVYKNQTIEEKIESQDEAIKMPTVTQSGQRLVHQAIDAAEAVVEILDARCPEAYRNFSVEKYIQNSKKPFIKVFTKIDLVDESVIKLWKSSLKGSIYLVKCNTQSQKHNLSRNAGPSSAKGIDALYGQLSKYRTVAFFGAPSVGKSSLINSLCRERVATSGKNDGTTKGLMQVAISKKLKVLDTPGIYPDTPNVIIKILQNRDVNALYNWFNSENALAKLAMAFNIPHPQNCDDFVRYVAEKYKFMSKGCIDLSRAHEKILKDFRDLGFWSCSPQPNGFVLNVTAAKLNEMEVDESNEEDGMEEWMEEELGA